MVLEMRTEVQHCVVRLRAHAAPVLGRATFGGMGGGAQAIEAQALLLCADETLLLWHCSEFRAHESEMVSIAEMAFSLGVTVAGGVGLRALH